MRMLLHTLHAPREVSGDEFASITARRVTAGAALADTRKFLIRLGKTFGTCALDELPFARRNGLRGQPARLRHTHPPTNTPRTT